MNHEEMSIKVQNHEEILLGKNGEPGVAHKVGFMWRIQTLVFCLLSAAGGFIFHTVWNALTTWGIKS